MPQALCLPFDQLVFTYTSAPTGASDSLASLKNCLPNGMPTMVMHHSSPKKKWVAASARPPKKNHITFTMNENAPPV